MIFWALGIFISVEIGIGCLESYTAVGLFGLLLITSGIVFLISLIFNMRESRENNRMSRGMILTIISLPPIAFCYLAILIKALTEGH
ncbi:MAG: hypothetical protein HQ569_07425 [Actinobacteria bacterium]|nr:hypothetical protein [Actinomycetota bacterium]